MMRLEWFFEEAMHADVLLQVCDSSPDISLALYVALSLAVGCRGVIFRQNTFQTSGLNSQWASLIKLVENI